jgi:hypothetical protein
MIDNVRVTCAAWIVLAAGCFTEPPPVGEGGEADGTVSTTAGTSDTTAGATTQPTTTAPTSATSVDTTSDATGTSTTATAEVGSVGTTGSGTAGGNEVVIEHLYDRLCLADIRSYESPACPDVSCQTPIVCNSQAGALSGHAYTLDSADAEGTGDVTRVIELATYPLPDALITAHFDGVSLQGTAAPHLRARVWCGPAPCHAWWQIAVVDGPIDVASSEGDEVVDGIAAEVDLDLAAAAGNMVRVTLRMSNHGAFEMGDVIRFEDVRVVDLTD